jgi:hypothetical protein
MAKESAGVPWGDHDPDPQGSERTDDSDHGGRDDSAGQKAHGTHGRGAGDREEKLDDQPAAPGGAKGSDRGGSAAWGSEASGGSEFDKRADR